MSKKKKKVLAVFELPTDCSHHDKIKDYLKLESWEDEKDVYNALKRLGYEVCLHGLKSNLGSLLEKIKIFQPMII